MMLRASLVLLLLLFLPSSISAITFDTWSTTNDRNVQDAALESLIHASIGWLRARALYTEYPILTQYADELQQVLRPTCSRCHDYFEAVAIVRSLGRTIKRVIQDNREDTHYPVIRRSYVAAVWMLQRTKLFSWQASQLHSNMLSTLFRLYVHHSNRAQGRAVSFHHVSKCGGTTMCQLAANNRCSNPSMDMDRNCVLDSSLDGPIWMVAHDVSRQGVTPNTTYGLLGAAAAAAPDPWANLSWPERYKRSHQLFTEPELPMWLMYSCPYAPLGKSYDCQARNKMVIAARSNFLANERTLTQEDGTSQVCPEFTNAIILRDPVPHVASLLAEVRFRYVRQLAAHNISNWQPPMWNLTWWETLGPALVGNYATRTLVGRESFCRSASNLTHHDLSRAVDALLGFDMVMTLDRARDIDVLVSTMLGWPARSFSSQPASRVKAVRPKTSTLNWDSMGGDSSSVQSEASSTQSRRGSGQQLQQEGEGKADSSGFLARVLGRSHISSNGGSTSILKSVLLPASRRISRSLQQLLGAPQKEPSMNPFAAIGFPNPDSASGSSSSSSTFSANSADSMSDLHSGSTHDYDQQSVDVSQEHSVSDAEFERVAAAMASFDAPDPPETPPLPPEPSPEELEAAAAVALVKSSWQERQAQLWGFRSVRALESGLLPEPEVDYMQQVDRHGAYLVRVRPAVPLSNSSSSSSSSRRDGGPGSNNSSSSLQGAGSPTGEVWHAFPRHNVAFTHTDMLRLENLTRLDQELVQLAGLLLDLDTVWLQSLLHNNHYRKRMKAVATTHTACGFAGMMPPSDTVQDDVFQPSGLSKSTQWMS